MSKSVEELLAGSHSFLAAYPKQPKCDQALRDAAGRPTVYLVACCRQKLDVAAKASEIYCSDLFKKSRAFVESKGREWWILSAQHGLLSPGRRIQPYDLSLADLSRTKRQDWAKMVAGQIAARIGYNAELVFLAGSDYRNRLLPLLKNPYRIPMLGLGIGQQKAWLLSQTEVA